MKSIVFAAVALLCSFTQVNAADPSSLYKQSTLEYWGKRYERSTTKILEQVIWPVLLSDEKSQLGHKSVLEFPLYAEGEARQHALAFYVPADRNSIVFPIFSLKFLDDLCTAYAWLKIKGYSLETISEYTAILKYGELSPDDIPSPLQALGVPENALDDPQVDELALGHFVTARTFLLLHEMGHVLYGHQARTFAESVRNEQQADRFAATVMQRTPLPPLGIMIFFLADAHWSGFPASGRDTHPLSGERVKELANYVDDRNLARMLRKFGDLLDDPDVRAGFVATGKAGDLSALAPRRPGELPRVQIKPSEGTPTTFFEGFYRGEFVQFPEPEPTAIELSLERRNNYVQGRYSFGLGVGTIKGTVESKQLYFNWKWAGNYGQGIFKIRKDGSFTGTWGNREVRSGAGTWSGVPTQR
jgi:hypothetical protein